MSVASSSTKLEPHELRVGMVVMLGTIMAILDTTIVAVALDDLSRNFHVSIATIQWVTTGYLLALAIVIPVTGWGIHRIGAKPLYITSLALFIVGSILCGVAWSATSLIMFRVLQGLGGGMIMPVGQTILTRMAGPLRLGRVMGIIGVPTVLGPILGPVIGGAIITHGSWRWIFLVNVPIGIVALFMATKTLPRSEGDRNHRFDLLGFALLSPGLALVVYGLSQVPNGAGFAGTSVQVNLSLGLILCVLFVVRSLKAPEPLIDVRLFKERNFSVASISIFLLGATLYGNMFLLPLYYQVVRGQSAWVAGLMMAPQGIGAGLMMRPAGVFSDRHGPRLVVPLGMALLAIGTLGYTQVSGTSNFAVLGVSLFVRGMGLGIAMMPVTAASYRGLTHHQIPRATTVINIMRQIGGSLGVAIFAVVLQQQIIHQLPHSPAVIGQVPHVLPPGIMESLAHAFATSFWWSFGTCALALIPPLFLTRGAAISRPAGELVPQE